MLFLDEPSTGLDPQTRLLLWEIIREYNRDGKTILLTTHNMDEADSLCHRIAIVDHGKVIAMGTPAELKSSIPGGYLVRVQFSAPVNGLADRLRELPGVTEVKASGDSVDIYADRGGALVGADRRGRVRGRAGSVTTSTFRNPASRICSCTTREGACGNELEHVFRDAGGAMRTSRGGISSR